MPSKQTLSINVMSCGAMLDLMSEQEANFLNTSLSLFRNVQELGRSLPRANVSLTRVHNPGQFKASCSNRFDLLHLIAHGDAADLAIGHKYRIAAEELAEEAKSGLRLPPVVVSTACKMNSKAWHAALRACGVDLLIAADQAVTPANLLAFDMSFYSALLSQVRRGRDTDFRVKESFRLADEHYRAIHALGTPFAKFRLTDLR